MKKLHAIKVLSHDYLGGGGYVLVLSRPFDFVPGQVVGLTVDASQEPRLYSIASGSQQPELWILYTVKPEGVLTPRLKDLQKGDVLFVSPPFGNFTAVKGKAVWIATGTGIAPFASMLFSGMHHEKILIHGNRNREGLYFFDEFAAALPDAYHPCCSRVPHSGCFNGRVTDYLQTFKQLDDTIPYYLCGTAEMVVEVRDLLIEMGVPFQKIMAEIFF